MAKCNCPDKSKCGCKELSGKSKKIKTGGRVTNGRYDHTPQTRKALNKDTRSNRSNLYSFRVKKGQMTPERAAELERRDKKLNFH